MTLINQAKCNGILFENAKKIASKHSSRLAVYLYGNRGEKSQLSCAAFEAVLYMGCNLAFMISQQNMARVIII